MNSDPLLINLKRWLPAFLVVIIVAAYLSSFSASFMFDDFIRIVDNSDITDLRALARPSTRPLVEFTFWLSYALSGPNPADFRAVNVAIHIVAAILLYGIVRRSLLLPRFIGKYASSAHILAVLSAGLWALHPLQTESVTYIVQRSESMMGMFLLLALYAFIRTLDGRHTRMWNTSCVLACALGMMCKPTMIMAPVLILIYDRVALSGSFRTALRGRSWLYSGLGASWLIVAWLVLKPNVSASSAGFSAGLISPLHYLLTQFGVIAHYTRLAFWPVDLCFDYAWPPADVSVGSLTCGAITVALLLVSVIGICRGNAWALPAAWFFVTLAPTSSILPIADYAAEHRMYLPLAGLVVLALLGGHHLLVTRILPPARRALLWRAFCLAVICLVVGLGLLTSRRNRVYQSRLTMAADTIEKRPENLRARTSLTSALMRRGRADEARDAILEMLTVIEAMKKAGPASGWTGASDPVYFYPGALTQLGRVNILLGRHHEAVTNFTEVVVLLPNKPLSHHNLAVAFAAIGRYALAEEAALRSLSMGGKDVGSNHLLGELSLRKGAFIAARTYFEAEVASSIPSPAAMLRLAWLLATGSEASLSPLDPCVATIPVSSCAISPIGPPESVSLLCFRFRGDCEPASRAARSCSRSSRAVSALACSIHAATDSGDAWREIQVAATRPMGRRPSSPVRASSRPGRTSRPRPREARSRTQRPERPKRSRAWSS